MAKSVKNGKMAMMRQENGMYARLKVEFKTAKIEDGLM